MKALFLLLLSQLLCLDSYAQTKNTASRLALVIGNASYASSPLKNPVNDSRAVAASLRELGFEVIERENTNLRDLIAALQSFSLAAKHNQTRMIFYAGHGMQVKGRNYLIPVDADIASEEEVPRKGADVGDLLMRLGELKHGLNIVILDACRNNPFSGHPMLSSDGRRLKTRGVGANAQEGLAKLDAPNGTLVAYSTAPGSTAIDNSAHKNSVYTKHLLMHLPTPNQTIEQMFKRVRLGVANDTQNLQIPWETSSLMGDFCFKNGAKNSCGL
ncbi:MAG: hypothetical protein RLZZ502_1452 [Pseudomonadota bacterium]|jgi:uncharacterized caspase-like protein